jgi:hypothetical protein
MIPITPASELRDDPAWMEEMLPLFEESCFADPDCLAQGWSLLIYAGMYVYIYIYAYMYIYEMGYIYIYCIYIYM